MSLLTLAEVARAITGSSDAVLTADETATYGTIAAAVDVVVARFAGAGASSQAPQTWSRFAPSAGPLVLPWKYAYVSAVKVNGVTVDAAQYDDETRAAMGILDPATGYAPWYAGAKVEVTAVVGPATVGADVLRAAYILARHWGQTDRQNGRGAWADENGQPLDASIPNSVRMLLTGNALAGVG